MDSDAINNVGTSDSRRSVDSSGSSGSSISLRDRFRAKLTRPRSLINLVRPSRNKVLLQSNSSLDLPSQVKKTQSTKAGSSKKGWNSIVTIVVVEARGLPDLPSDSSAHTIYCKIRLGTQRCKSKSVPSARNPEWRERLKLFPINDHILKISLWDKGKQKNFMGSCIVDLSGLEKERAHEIWQPLDNGFGSVHLNITVCAIRNDNVSSEPEPGPDLKSIQEEFALLNLKTSWKVVGQLHVKVVGARGLSGKPNAYCTLEVDNERVQTSVARAGSEPVWNKYYSFNVYDVTSTLDIKIQDNSLVNSLLMEYLGKVSIPLLRISNGAPRWYALKDKSKRNNAKGNCPRILLEMTVIWNPVKAAIRVFRPKEVKYVKKPTKFDIALVHRNLESIRDIFVFLFELNESYKRFLEWDNKDLCSIVLIVWLIFWYHFELWVVPLLLLMPFFYHLIHMRYEPYYNILIWPAKLMIAEDRFRKNIRLNLSDPHQLHMAVQGMLEDQSGYNENEKKETLLHSLTGKIQTLPETTLIITNGIEYIVSILERLYNLVSFQVPFLSFLSMMILAVASIVLYLIPIKYLLMALGTYKYTRKWLNPQRTPNNDLLDFISRIPDFDMMKDWKELSVPEPSQQENSSINTTSGRDK